MLINFLKSNAPLSIVTKPLVVLNIPLSKLATPKSFCVMPVAFALVVAAFKFNLLCAIAAFDLTSAFIILSGAICKSKVVPVPVLSVTTLMSETAS